MRIIAGSHKGRIIPFDNRKFGNADATPQKIKEALFSILGENLDGCTFLDLYSCSGQIGLEAVSRGCRLTVFNEKDRKRYEFIKRLVMEWELADQARAFNMHAFTCLKYLDSQHSLFDYIYLDPPYIKQKGTMHVYTGILEELSKYSLLSKEAQVIVQHYVHNTMAVEAGILVLTDRRVYGSNALAFYRMKV